MKKIKVVFRKWKNGQIIALFPEEDAGNNYCESYEHVGQHGGANYNGVIKYTTPATPAEYKDLKKELESAPYHYNFKVIKRYTSK